VAQGGAPGCRREAERLLTSDAVLDADLAQWNAAVGRRLRLRLLGPVPVVLGAGSELAVCGVAGGLLSMLATRELGVSMPEAAARLYPGQEPEAASRQAGRAARNLEQQLAAAGGTGQAHLTVTAMPGFAPVIRLRGVLRDTELFRRLRLRAAAGHSQAIPVARELARGLADLSEADLASPLWHAVAFWVALQELDLVTGEPELGPHTTEPAQNGGSSDIWVHVPGKDRTAVGRSGCPGGWLLAELGRPQRGRCPAHGGDVDVSGTRLLTLCELREALQGLGDGRVGPRNDVPPPPAGQGRSTPGRHHVAIAEPDVATDSTSEVPSPRIVPSAFPLPPTVGWLRVVCAHGGAGGSTVALALADAAAGQGRAVQLLTTGGDAVLAAVTDRELGMDASGGWRTGRRGRAVTVHRLTRSPGADSPMPVIEPPAQLVVLDLPRGRADLTNMHGCPPGSVVVLVCRLSVPGILSAEARLAAMTPDCRLVLVTVGGGRWPTAVRAAAGPRVRELLAAHRVAAVPYERALAVRGPTAAPLPAALVRAARTVLRLVDAPPGSRFAAGPLSAASAGSHPSLEVFA